MASMRAVQVSSPGGPLEMVAREVPHPGRGEALVHVHGGARAVTGHPSGSSIESEDTLSFSALSGVRAKIEALPLARAQEAFDRMLSGQARFRMVLTTAS